MPKQVQRNIGRKVALGGLITALAVICLYLSNVLPTNRLFFYGLSTVFLLTMVIEYGPASAFAVYGATVLVAAILLPNKIPLIPYVLFFGYYGIFKYFVERIQHFVLEWIVKLCAFTAAMGVTYWLVSSVFFQSVTFKFPLWVMALLAEAVFIIYDIAYSLAAKYYVQRIRKLIGR